MAGKESPAFVPGFLEDIFISYAHRDEGLEKWVSWFRKLLQEKLEYELRAGVRVWSDEELAAGSALDATLKKRIQNSAIFLPIISPWYFERPWCQAEFNYFFQAAQSSRGLVVGTTSRLIPIVKREVDAWPQEIRDLDPLMVRFCQADRTFPPIVEGGSDFFNAAERLARDLKGLLEEMKQQSAAQSASESVLVFAPMSGVRRKENEHLINFLARKDRAAGPSGELPRTRTEILSLFESQIASATLVIHLLGPFYDMLPAGERRSSVEELLIDAARNSGKRQLIWIESETLDDEGQRELLARVKSFCDQQTELISGPFSKFLESLPEELDHSRTASEIRDQGVYLICDKSDLSQPECVAMRSYFASKGFPLTLPSFQGDPEELRQLEAEQVLSHDITLIFFGNAPDIWAERKRSDTRKTLLAKPPQERPKRALYLAPPDAEGLKAQKYGPFLGASMPEIGKMSIVVLGGFGPFEAGRIEPLLNQ